jgi:Spy/CpxP family protein refolding chaperone
MKFLVLRVVLVTIGLIVATGVAAHGQGRPGPAPGPGGPPSPPPGSGPGGAPPTSGSGPAGGSQAARASNGGMHSALGLGPVGRWWDDKSTVQAVGLSKVQTKKMDAIFNANKAAIVASYQTFLKQQSALDALSKDSSVDKSKLFAAIDSVNQARSNLQKTTTQMLLQIRQQMDAEQLARLDKLQ